MAKKVIERKALAETPTNYKGNEICLIEETLSDGSTVYNIEIRDMDMDAGIEIACANEKFANDLFESLTSVDVSSINMF